MLYRPRTGYHKGRFGSVVHDLLIVVCSRCRFLPSEVILCSLVGSVRAERFFMVIGSDEAEHLPFCVELQCCLCPRCTIFGIKLPGLRVYLFRPYCCCGCDILMQKTLHGPSYVTNDGVARRVTSCPGRRNHAPLHCCCTVRRCIWNVDNLK